MTAPLYPEFRAYRLKEVAEITGLSLRRIEEDCRKRRVEHLQLGQTRYMTANQINKMLTAYTVAAVWVDELNDMQLTIEMTRRSGARYKSRRRSA